MAACDRTRPHQVSIERRNFPQFFITAAAPCPYIAGRVERKVFTHLVGHEARGAQYPAIPGRFPPKPEHRLPPGLRRMRCLRFGAGSGQQFRARAGRCGATLKANTDIESIVAKARSNSEHYALFRAYIDTRHADGGMADMSVLDFSAMIDDNFVDSRLVEYRVKQGQPGDGQLVAAVLIDILGDGLSMIYSYYEPELEASRAWHLHDPGQYGARQAAGPSLSLSRLLGLGVPEDGLQGPILAAGKAVQPMAGCCTTAPEIKNQFRVVNQTLAYPWENPCLAACALFLGGNSIDVKVNSDYWLSR